ncbi:discoidin domain-containing protein [Paenibacillus sp. TC-CSREp1]|uniref:discoidin domain-containing protein n=1 Tax=Paenibacillus sp. TC-CSREp1 TaxID=3410089 RepID=UPI003CE6D0CF
MATIGDQLTAPESDWRRYDDIDPVIVYTGTWSTETLAGNFGGSAKYTSTIGSVMSFTFFGTKLRIIGGLYSGRTTTAQVIIDGAVVGTINEDSTTSRTKALVFEKSGLTKGNHVVQIKAMDTKVLILDAVDVDEDGYLTRTIGTVLTTPDTGWKRYDNTDSGFKYTGSSWIHESNTSANNYNKTDSYTKDSIGGHSIKFNFYGTKLRLIQASFYKNDFYSDEAKIIIDGVQETFSKKDSNSSSTVPNRQMLLYEKLGLELKVHTVEILSGSNGVYRIQNDAIDIDSDGRLFHPDEVTNPIDLTIGKRIRCYYSTNNGVVGNFAFFGQETAPFITTSAGAGGDLYFICVDKDHAGRLKLIADRNIQHSISWDAINASGVASGSGVQLPKSGYYSSMIPAMTSNTSPQGVAAASTIYSASLDAWKAFDKNTTDAGWLMQSGKWNGAWISYTFSHPTVINKYGIKGPNSNASTDCAKSWRFEGSNDGTNWTVLDTRTNQPAWSTGEYREYVCTNKANYNTYRLVYTANYGGAYVRTMAVDMFQLIEENSMPSVDLLTLRLPTGGINSSDKDNEWDQYIVNSTLDGKVTAGDNNVWNYNGGASWTSTTNVAGSSNRTGRGANGDAGASGYNPSAYVAAATATGFRPVMEVTILPMYRSLIKYEGNYDKYSLNEYIKSSNNNAIPNMTSNTSPSGVASASSMYVGVSTYEPWKAFNGTSSDGSDGWATENGKVSGWLAYKFTNPINIYKYAITSRNSAESGAHSIDSAPKTWTFEGSNDGDNWVVLDTRVNVTGWNINETKNFELERKYISNFVHYRLNISENNGWGSFTCFAELRLFEIKIISTSGWSTVSTTSPPENTFINEGMGDLSILDRKSMDIVQVMTNTGDLGSGKVFKSTVSLKKYIDINNFYVK